MFELLRETFVLPYKLCKRCKSRVVGPSGLKSQGEICYMSSMIQALAASEKLILEYKDLCGDQNIPELKQFVDVLQNGREYEYWRRFPLFDGYRTAHHYRINNGGNNKDSLIYNSNALKELTATVNWDRLSQQDAFQMLSFFINSIQNKMKPILEENKKTMPPKFILLHSFDENSSYNKLQDHLALSVPLIGPYREKPGVGLIDLLVAFFVPSVIDDGPHTTTMSMFGKAPDVMILHIQANEWSPERGEYIKPTYYIRYHQILEYKFKIHRKIDGSQEENVRVQYRLVAVVQHTGDVGGGHYVTYRMHGDQWYLTNDEQVKKVNFKYDVVPYVMVFEIVKKGN